MNNYNFTQSLDGLNNIEANNINTSNLNVENITADTADITTLSDCNLINCTAETPVNPTSIVNKNYADNNFLDRANNLTQSINGAKTFNSIITCGVAPVNPNDITNKEYVDGMPIHQILNTDNIWTGLNEFNKTITFKQNLGAPSSTIKQIGNNLLINNLTNSGQMIFNMLSGGGIPRDILIMDFTQMTLQLVPLTIKYASTQYTNLEQTAQSFSIENKSVSGDVRIRCRTAGGADTILATFNTTGISIGVSSITNTISGPTTFNNYPSCSLAPVLADHLVNRTYADTKTTLSEVQNNNNSFTGTNSFNISTFSGQATFSAQVIFNNLCPISNTNATVNNHLTTLGYNNGKYIDFISNQDVSGNKTFTNITSTRILYTKDLRFNDAGGGSNIFQIYLTGESLAFVPLYNNNTYQFQCRDANTITTTPLTISSTSTTISNNLVANTQATFNNFTPICSVASPTAVNHLTRKDYVDNNFMNLTTAQTVAGDKIFNGNTTYNGGGLFCNCQAEFATLVYLKNVLRSYDIVSPFTNFTKLYTSGNTFFIYPEFTNSAIHFYCRSSTFTEVQTFTSSATSNTSLVPFIASNTATFNSSVFSNNLTALSTSGTQNIYTNITTGGIINIGSSTTTTNMQSSLTCSKGILVFEGMQLRDVSTPFSNFCQLYPQDSVMNYIMQAGPTTATGHNFFCYNNANTQITTFRINSGGVVVLDGLPIDVRQIKTQSPTATNHEIYTGMTTGTLTIGSLTSNVIHNSLTIFNAQSTFNTNAPISNTAPTLSTHLTRNDYVDNNFLFKTGNVQESISGYKTFLNRVDLNGGTALVVGTGTSTFNGTLTLNDQATFNTNAPISNTNATLNNHLTTLGFNDGKYIDFITDQTISATNKRFNGLFCTGLSITPTLGGSGNRQQMYISGSTLEIYPLFNSNFYNFWCKNASATDSNVIRIDYNNTIINNNLVCNNLTSPTTTSVNNIYTTLVSGGEINIGGTLGVNKFYGQTTFNSATIFNLGCTFLSLLTFSNSGTFAEIEQSSGSQLILRNTTNSKNIILSTTSASTGQIDNLVINTTSCNFQVPLTVSIGASIYSSFTSDTIGYKTPTGSASFQSLSSGSGVNSGQLTLDPGVWKIDYTATINITTTMTTLTSLEIFVANSSNGDLDIQGLDVKNFYGVSVVAPQKIKISASGTVVNTGTSTIYNLRAVSIFTGGAGNFLGNIVATRIS
jgi:hypothetical protein